ncbi:MAG: sugar phosphate isomerase/epimerase [Clostridia bacterium]|nr:sugar phosphate isomerase/epimerase [Clostridia bacterium]
MKKAISIWSFGDRTVKSGILLAVRAGFDGIELALDEKGEVGMESTPSELAGIRDFARDSGLAVHSLATGLYWTYSLTSNDMDQRQKAYKIALKQLEAAYALEADSVLIVPGAVGVDFAPSLGIVDYDIAYERSLEALSGLKDRAAELGISIGIENVWNKFLLSPLEFRDFIDKIGSPFVGAYLDVGNIVYDGYPEQWIRILGGRIKKVHFKDYRRGAAGIPGFVDLLSGDVDWPKVMEAFRQTGYDSWVTAEMLPPYTHHSDQIIFNTAASMSRILGG